MVKGLRRLVYTVVMLLALGAGAVNAASTVTTEGDPKAVTAPTVVNGIMLVNKKNPLPHTYEPPGITTVPGYSGSNGTKLESGTKEAVIALEKMRAAAKSANSSYGMPVISSYRSYAYQDTLYTRYVERDGADAADEYSSRPGFSEHQTGLTFDVGALSSSYGGTAEGKWLADNAHTYGFIIRYPKGKESITGYMYEPWHVRHIGIEAAEKMKGDEVQTLEEFLNAVGKNAADIGKVGESNSTGDTSLGGRQESGSTWEKFEPFKRYDINGSVVGVDTSHKELPGEMSYALSTNSEKFYKFAQKVMVVMGAILFAFVSLQAAGLAVINKGVAQEHIQKAEKFLYGSSVYDGGVGSYYKAVFINIVLLGFFLGLVFGSYYVGIQGRIYAGIAYIMSLLF